MGNQPAIPVTADELYAAIEKRKEWFFECQLRRLELESMYDTAVDEKNLSPLAGLIAKKSTDPPPLGSTAIDPVYVYLDSGKPVWSDKEWARRKDFSGTFIGKTNNWLNYSVPHELIAAVQHLKEVFELDKNKFKSIADQDAELNNFQRNDPSLFRVTSPPLTDPSEVRRPADDKDANRLSHAVVRAAITEQRPWLIPEIFNAFNPDTKPLENWLFNAEKFIDDHEKEMTDVFNEGQDLPAFTLATQLAYRSHVATLLQKSVTGKRPDVFTQLFTKTGDDYEFFVYFKFPAQRDGISLTSYTSENTKYWIDSCKNAIASIYVNKPDSDMSMCLIMRAVYLYGTLPAGFNGDNTPEWRKNRQPTPALMPEFFNTKADLAINPDLLMRLDNVRIKLSIWLDETAANPLSAAVQFSPVAQEIMKKVMLGFKFWIDEPFSPYYNTGDPGNEESLMGINKARQNFKDAGLLGQDAYLFSEMEYWSENHYAMFASSEHLAGQLYPEETFLPAKDFFGNRFVITTKGKPELKDLQDAQHSFTGQQRMQRGKARILKWLNNKLMFGWAEFNSSGYYREHMMALLNLVDFSLDKQVKQKATTVLDLLFFDLMRFSHKGAMGAAGGRSQFKSKSCGWDNAVGDAMEIILGNRGLFVNREGDIGFIIATSTYKVPEVLLRIGLFPPDDGYVDRARVSLTFQEASKFGIQYSKSSDQKESIQQGFADKRRRYYPFLQTTNDDIKDAHLGYGAMEDDTVFWWTMSAFFNKEVVKNSLDLIDRFNLKKCEVFEKLIGMVKTLIPLVEKTYHGIIGAAIGSLGSGASVIAGAAAGFFFDDVFDYSIIEEGSNDFAFFLEGSTRTRANIYAFRNRDIMLSSLQNFRPGQLNFQSNVNQATINTSLNVFTTAAFAGLDTSSFEAAGLGGLLGMALTTGVAGGIYGGFIAVAVNETKVKGKETLATHGDGPGWWTGYWALPMVAQYKNTAIIAYDFNRFQKEIAVTGSHTWFPKDGFKTTEERRTARYDDDNFALWDIGDIGAKGFWLFGQVAPYKKNGVVIDDQEAYIGVFSNQSPDWQTWDSDFYASQFSVSQHKDLTDFFAERDWYAKGKNIWIIQVGNKKEYGSFDNFKNWLTNAKVTVDDAGDMGCTYHIPGYDGKVETLSLDYSGDGACKVNGEHFDLDNYPRFENPFVRSGRVEWGQRQYVIEYAGASLLHDLSNMNDTLRKENWVHHPSDELTVKAIMIFLRTADDDLDVFTYAVATVQIGCVPVTDEQPIAAGNVDAHTIQDGEWIFFDMPALSAPDMTIDIGHRIIVGKASSAKKWTMDFELVALMGDCTLRGVSVKKISPAVYFLREESRNTGLIPFTITLARWRDWRTIGILNDVTPWTFAGQPQTRLYYFDHVHTFGFNNNRLFHQQLGPCQAATALAELSNNDALAPTIYNASHFHAFSSKPDNLFLFLLSENKLYTREKFATENWTSRHWETGDISYLPVLDILGIKIIDNNANSLPVPLGPFSRARACFINADIPYPAVIVSGSDGNFYGCMSWPLTQPGHWQLIMTAGQFIPLADHEWLIAGNFLWVLDSNRSLWRYALDFSNGLYNGNWELLPVPPAAIIKFDIVFFDDYYMTVAIAPGGQVISLLSSQKSTGSVWEEVGIHSGFRAAPGTFVKCAYPGNGKIWAIVCTITGGVFATWWSATEGWETNHNWEVIAPKDQPFVASPNRDIQLISRVEGLLEVYVTGSDNQQWKNWYS